MQSGSGACLCQALAWLIAKQLSVFLTAFQLDWGLATGLQVQQLLEPPQTYFGATRKPDLRCSLLLQTHGFSHCDRCNRERLLSSSHVVGSMHVSCVSVHMWGDGDGPQNHTLSRYDGFPKFSKAPATSSVLGETACLFRHMHWQTITVEWGVGRFFLFAHKNKN
jgi:hypothetical protein